MFRTNLAFPKLSVLSLYNNSKVSVSFSLASVEIIKSDFRQKDSKISYNSFGVKSLK
ncbi:hypothetical protein D3C85_1582480 [compost metagenome]